VFESLTDKLQGVFKRLRGQGTLTEENISEALREVRRALLEADVSLEVVKPFIQRVKEQALGQDVLRGINPGQQFIKAVHDELVSILGGERPPLAERHPGPTVILMVGLQGSGKTTTTAKLGLYLRKKGRNPLLVACDVYRPAAIRQLEVLGKQLDIPVFSQEGQSDVVAIARDGIAFARANGRDYVLIDTAGRLHVDEAMMDEIRRLRATVDPAEVLLVVDAMTGQDAVRIAAAFHEAVQVTGLVVTKLDGDTRGGAALSVKHVTGQSIKFAGVGEKPDALEPFHPDRIATRILGMGDVLTLIERAQESIDADEAKRLEQRFRKAEFDLEDFMSQLRQVRKLGSMGQILEMLPIGKMLGVDLTADHISQGEAQLRKFEVIVSSMTVYERQNPGKIDSSRKRRIARGSGTSVQDINTLLKQVEAMRGVMKQFGAFEKQMGKRFGRMARQQGSGFPFPFPPSGNKGS
jgi:signal recognition particle subunit SRP54